MDISLLPFLNLKALCISVLAAVLVYFGFIGFVILNGGKTIAKIEDNLASYVVALEKPVIKEKPATLPIASKEQNDISDVLGVQKKGLAPAPFEGLTQNTAAGVLPVKGSNGLTPFDAYKKPFTRNRDRPAIALILKDYGLSSQLSKSALSKIPSIVSILISPYSYDPDALQVKARQNGHEVWLQLPSETSNFPADDPGPKGILANASLKFNQDNLEWVMTRTTGYVGLASVSDTAFVNAQSMYKNLFSNIYGRGLGYFEINDGAANSLPEALALTNNAPYAKNTLPANFDFLAPHEAIEHLKAQAQANGQAVGVLKLTPALLSTLQTHINAAQDEGFDIVPLSALADPS